MSDITITEVEIVEEYHLRFWFAEKGGRIHERRFETERDATAAMKNLWSNYDDVVTVIEKVTVKRSILSREEIVSATPVRSRAS